MTAALPDKAALEVDPREALEPFRPGVDGAWDRGAAAHLLRRAGFGAAPAEIDRALAAGAEATARELYRLQEEPEELTFVANSAAQLSSLPAAQAAWVLRMARGPSPAIEKLALFWHGRFATSNAKVDDVRLMMRQIDLFRLHGTSPFAELLLGVAKDPAMLLWLDGNSNRRGKPNENFAREIMELFALGIGNYTEADIKEAARAFTGWHVKDREFWFNDRAHDPGPKTVFGKTGPFGGEELVRLCAEREACSEFIASKLFEFYVHPEPSVPLRPELGRAYAGCGQKTGEFLVRLLSSRVFFSPRARRALVASPVEFVVGSLRTLEAFASPHQLARAITAMGQELFQPPSVKGWDAGFSWLSSGTLLARYRFAQGLNSESGGDLEPQVQWDRIGSDAALIVARFFPEGVAPQTVEDLLAASKGESRSVVVGCLELPEAQFV